MSTEPAKRLYREAVDAVMAPDEAGRLWRTVLVCLPVPIPILALVALAVGGGWSAAGVWILASGSVAVAALLLAAVVQPSPLPEGLSTGASVRRSLHRYRQITTLRIALGLVPVAVGAGCSIAGGGLLPLAAAMALSWPQLALAAPTFFSITRARRAMEAWGTKAYLWAALAQPAPVEWPVLTPAAAWIRARLDARRAGGAQPPAEAAGPAAGPGEEPDDEAEAATGLPTRLAAPSAARQEPADLVPGFPVQDPATATGPRPIVRAAAPARRPLRPLRRDRRSKTKR
ncbi:hypothetical protein J0910_21910 [Nocardiopsis sp. CNT-189]|uniref:hypothetical protein n=1 Tax=Nocardiopsis oceanisediminis TaxID=2816862 RepID=UPI003B30AB4D